MTNVPVLVGAQGRDLVPCQGRERAGGRVSVGVSLADRDHREPRPRAIEQRAEPGVVAAVMGDLEDVDRARSIGTASASASAVSSM